MDEDRVLVTNNAKHFLRLAAHAGVHPGMVVLPLQTKAGQQRNLELAIAHIEATASREKTRPAHLMINRVVEMEENGACSDWKYPPTG